MENLEKNAYMLKTFYQNWIMKKNPENWNRPAMYNEFESIIRNYQQQQQKNLSCSYSFTGDFNKTSY